MKRFKVVSIHYTTECNLDCPFCYKKKTAKGKEKPLKFWYDLVPHIAKLTNQIALGGGEPFTNIRFIKKFGKICKKNKVKLNITSNGHLLFDLDIRELQEVLKNVTMISLSFDEYKVQTPRMLIRYSELVFRIKQNTKCQVGCNLLVTRGMLQKEIPFIYLIKDIFDKFKVDRIFALCPKNMESPEILKLKNIYKYLTLKYKHFYVDDLTNKIIEEEKYSDWKTSCHYFKDIVSINEKGFVTGCSFDNEKDALLLLKKPEDIAKIVDVKSKERFSCPFLKIPAKQEEKTMEILNPNCSEAVMRIKVEDMDDSQISNLVSEIEEFMEKDEEMGADETSVSKTTMFGMKTVVIDGGAPYYKGSELRFFLTDKKNIPEKNIEIDEQ